MFARVIARNARGLSTEPVDTLGLVWEAVGRKADTQWVATNVGGAVMASFGAIGMGNSGAAKAATEENETINCCNRTHKCGGNPCDGALRHRIPLQWRA